MIALVKNEFIKLFSRKSSWIMPIILILITFAFAFLAMSTNNSLEKAERDIAAQRKSDPKLKGREEPESKGGIIAVKTPDGKLVEEQVFYGSPGSDPKSDPKKEGPEYVALTVEESIPVLEDAVKFYEKELKEAPNSESEKFAEAKIKSTKQQVAYYKRYKELKKTPPKIRSASSGMTKITNASFISSLGGGSFIATILCVIVASMIVATEFSGGTAKLLLTRPYSRMQIIWSKYIVSICYGILISLVMLLSAFAFSFLLPSQDFSVPLAEHTGGVTGLEMTLQYFGSNSLLILFYITVSLFISAVLRSQAFAVGVGMGFLFSGTILGEILPRLVGKVDFLKWIPFNLLGLNQQVLSPAFETAGRLSIPATVIGLIIYIIIFHAATLFIFKKRDVALT